MSAPTITQLPSPNEHALNVEGAPRDLFRHFKHAQITGDLTVHMAGLIVTKVEPGGRHDDQPAIRVMLAHGFGDLDAGRMTLIDTSEWREDRPEWQLWFDSEKDALAYKASEEARATSDQVDFEIDVAFNSGDVPDVLELEWTETYGLQFTMVDPHGPSAGHPVYRVRGRKPNARRWLAEVYNMPDEAEQDELYLS